MSHTRVAGLPRTVSALALAALWLGGPGAASARDGVDDFRTKTEKWVETRQITSEERAEWEADKEILVATRDLLRKQKEALAAEIAELEESNTEADDERRDLLLERADHLRASKVLEDRIREMEEQVLAVVPRLPEPLRERLRPLLVQIPEDPARSEQALGQRLISVLGVLAQAEKWNGTANFVGETRSVGDAEQQVQVRTLYWGLAQAVYVDAQGRTAGIGRPGEEGWEFSNDPDLVDRARRLLDIYEGNVDDIQFVEIPVDIR